MIPLFPIISALAAGGVLVPHAAGGLIVTGAGGYVAGTFLSTNAVGWLLGVTGAATAGLGLATASLVGIVKGSASVAYAEASTVVANAGITGTTVGATGLAGKLQTIGLVCVKPAVLLAVAGVIASALIFAFLAFRLRDKSLSADPGEEVIFTDREASLIQRLLLRFEKQPEKISHLIYTPGPMGSSSVEKH